VFCATGCRSSDPADSSRTHERKDAAHRNESRERVGSVVEHVDEARSFDLSSDCRGCDHEPPYLSGGDRDSIHVRASGNDCDAEVEVESVCVADDRPAVDGGA